MAASEWQVSDEQKPLIEFPCRFPIKVMGPREDDFVTVIASLLGSMTERFNPADIEMRPSRTGKYLGLTCKVWVKSQEELDEVYRTLSSHPMVSVVL